MVIAVCVLQLDAASSGREPESLEYVAFGLGSATQPLASRCSWSPQPGPSADRRRPWYHPVILQLSGPKVGAEVSAAVGGVIITMQ